MTKFTLANLGKEVQRIQYDIEQMDYKSAIESEDYLLVYLFDKLKGVCKIGGVIDDL